MADVKISQLPDGTALSGLEEVAVVQGGETVKVLAQDFMDFISGGNLGLDNVLANGNISTRNIKLVTGAYIEADGYIKTRRSRITDGTFSGEIKAPVANYTADRFYRMPDASGTFVITINGVAPDANGNISLTTGAHTHPISDIVGLQTVLDTKITIADADVRYYPLSTNPAGYLTASDVPVPTLQQVTEESEYTTIGIRLKDADTDDLLAELFNDGSGELSLYSYVSGKTYESYINSTGLGFMQQGTGGWDFRFKTDYLNASSLPTGFQLPLVDTLWAELPSDLPDDTFEPVLPVSVNGVFATRNGNIELPAGVTSVNGLTGDVEIGLQSVTDVSFTTTNPINAGGFATAGTSFAGDHAIYPSGHLRFVDITSTYNFQFELGLLSHDVVVTLPNTTNVTPVLPLSVNGVFADGGGDIAVEAFQDLQSVLNLGSTATNAAVELTDGSYLLTDMYLQSNEVRINSSNGDPGDYHNFFSYDGQPAIGNGTNYLYYFRADGHGFRGRSIFTGNYVWEVQATSISGNRTYNLPNASGMLPISVNGQTADAAGNITISTGGVTSVSGTTNRITISGTTTPAIDISSAYVGQTSITTLGTITTGTWQGTAISDTYISSASTWNAKQSALSGTGFVKISGTTISYDNSTYLTASSTATLTNKSGNISQWTNDSGYLTANQSIAFTGDVTGSGTTSVTLSIGSGKVTNTMLAGSIAYNKLVLSNSIVNNDISTSAGIALSKMAAMTALRVPVSDSSGFLVPSAVTAGELFYLSGTTSNIQTQFNNIGSVWTDYSATSTITGFSGYARKYIQYNIVGKTMYVMFDIQSSTGGGNGSTVSFTLPNNASSWGNTQYTIVHCTNNNTTQAAGLALIDAGTNTLYFSITAATSNTTGWTTATTRGIQGTVIINIA
ncbi:MAG: hypothetical protein QM737_02710 [Ferruginibacter sp.]